MSWSNPLSAYLLGGLFLVAALGIGVSYRIRGQGGWVAALGGVSLVVIGLTFMLTNTLGSPGGLLEIMMRRAIELPIIAFTSTIYLTLAGKLASPRRRAVPFRALSERPRLRKLFVWSPLVLLLAWGYDCVAETIWSIPLNVLAEAPPRSIFVILPAALPGMVYVGLASWVFAKSVKTSPSRRLYFKNASFAVALFCWFLANVNTTSQLGVASLAEDPVRTQITLAQLTVQAYLVVPFLISLVAALTLTAAPAINEKLVRKMIGRLESQDSFEVERWLIGSSGKLKRITRATFYGAKAAEILDLPESEADKVVTTIELAYLFSDPPEELGEVTPERARELLHLGREITKDETLAASLSRLQGGEDTADSRVLGVSFLQEILETSLIISGENGDYGIDSALAERLWVHLAVIATEERGDSSAEEILPAKDLESLTRRRALNAYSQARTLADSTVSEGG